MIKLEDRNVVLEEAALLCESFIRNHNMLNEIILASSKGELHFGDHNTPYDITYKHCGDEIRKLKT